MARRSSFERLKELERGHTRSRARSYANDESWRDDTYRYAEYRLSNDDPNRMAPPEEVTDRRRRKHHPVAISPNTPAANNQLTENIILLLFLIGSIYGLYKLTLYMLTQS